MNPVLKLKQEIRYDCEVIPDFINTRKTEHFQSFTILSNVLLESVYLCCSAKIITYDEIERVAIDIVLAIGEIRDITNGLLYTKVQKYLMELLDKYEGLSVALEVYESSENFNRLKSILSGSKKLKP